MRTPKGKIRCTTCDGYGYLWMAQFGQMECRDCNGQGHQHDGKGKD